jgi:alpha-D-ribose 1-methylphosphonate 5-triphosphate synthase subunit PhnL
VSAAVLSVRSLAKTFVLHNQGGARLPVLANVSFDVYGGECVVLDGASGVGKSTLLKCIYGSYRASGGAICVRAGGREVDVASAAPREVLALRLGAIRYVSQFLRAIPRVAALDLVAEQLAAEAPGDAEAMSRARREAEQLLLRLRIPMRLWSVPPATFSGGEQQRINIARSLIRPGSLLLLDEPTASLDPDNRATVVQLVNEARDRGAAIVGIFHDARVREAVATRVLDMRAFES